MTSGPLHNIHIIGPGPDAAIIGGAIARRCAGGAGKVTIAIVPVPAEDKSGHTILLRPELQRFHTEIELDLAELEQSAQARPAFATQYEGAALPFAPYGLNRDGVEFHHYWMRGNSLQKQPPLDHFCPALLLHKANNGPTLTMAGNMQIPYGISVHAEAYADRILAKARAFGAHIHAAAAEGPGSAPSDDSFVIDVTSHGLHAKTQGLKTPGWAGQCLWIDTASSICGIKTLRLYKAAQRFLDLLPARGENAAEQREYNRLSVAETERITDMQCLLSDDTAIMAQRPALMRKIMLFEACGRIPTEDYEVFQPPEWLAALMAAGYRPKRHDRLADRLSDGELTLWLGQLADKITAMKQQMEAA